jgi:2-polyprenyl-6-methoxyphenol hydroxylase-like FAD-dependent oxidoreductase
MRHTDVAIVGGGLAGSTAAAMLGRAGIDAILIDPHEVYPPDFRCEKLDGPQVRLLHKTGLAAAVLAATTPDRDVWVARFGRLVEKRASDQYGILYDRLVNAVRAEIPPGTEHIHAKTTAVATGHDRQRLTLSNGEEVSARLVVLANGLNIGLRHSLGLTREIVSASHSVTIGFDLNPVGRASFDFRALTYYAERTADRIAYLTLFPIGATMRANLFVYRDLHDAWMRALRTAPRDTLRALMPGLRKLTGDFEVEGFVKIRPADLYVTRGHRQPGIVLVGDAFATSCPAAGTGVRKVFTDVERLCNVYVPRWLASPGMATEKIAAFYDDPVKRACDTHSAAKAYSMRSLSIDAGIAWEAQRWTRFLARLGVGMLRQGRRRLAGHRDMPERPAAGSGIGLETQP